MRLAGRQQDASQFNATAQNTASAANANRALQSDTTNASEYDAMLSRLLQGGQAIGQTAEATSALGTQDVANLLSTGGVDQAAANNSDQAQYAEYLRAGSAASENYKDLMAILQGTPRNVTTTGTSNGTTTTQQSSSLFNSLLGLGSLGVSAYTGGVFGKH